MSGEKYYVIHSGEDGLDVDELSQEELLERIKPDEQGEVYYGGELLTKLPEINDGYIAGHGDRAFFIIKGKIISPKAKKVVTEFEVE